MVTWDKLLNLRLLNDLRITYTVIVDLVYKTVLYYSMANKLINLENVTKEGLTSISGVTTEMADKVMQRREVKELTTVDKYSH